MGALVNEEAAAEGSPPVVVPAVFYLVRWLRLVSGLLTSTSVVPFGSSASRPGPQRTETGMWILPFPEKFSPVILYLLASLPCPLQEDLTSETIRNNGL